MGRRGDAVVGENRVTRPVRNRGRKRGATEAAASVTAMDVTIHSSFLPQRRRPPEAALAFYRDAPRLRGPRRRLGTAGMRWDHHGPSRPARPARRSWLAPLAAYPGLTDDERSHHRRSEMMAKGTYATILLATRDLDGTFTQVQATDAEVVQEPTEQPYGVRDCAFRDPAGNMVRIQEVR